MKKQIWKFPLHHSNRIPMPIGSEILTVQTQNEIPCLWALVNPENETEMRLFEMIGTGHDITEDGAGERKYIGTLQLAGGALVWHVFERVK